MGIAGPLVLDGACAPQLSSRTGRAPAAPGVLRGQGFPLWQACEVSCRIRAREIVDPVRTKDAKRRATPRRTLRNVCFCCGLHPKAVFRRPMVVPPLLPVNGLIHLIRWQNSASDQVTLWYRRQYPTIGD